MAFLSGHPQDDEYSDESESDIADQPTAPLPLLAEAMALARIRSLVIPLCPICVMRHEEESGETLDLSYSIPKFCNRHKDWQQANNPDVARAVSRWALEQHLWPPGNRWPHLGEFHP